jgi:hypothetical protein
MTDKIETIDSDQDSPIYERQPEETAAAWAAFVCYRDMGARRSLAKVEKAQSQTDATTGPQQGHTDTDVDAGKNQRSGCLGRWSKRYNWVERAAAYDVEMDRAARWAHVEAVREMSKRHAQMARAGQLKAIQALQKLKPEEISAADVRSLIVELCKLERLCLGEATESVSQSQRVILQIVEKIVPIRGEVNTAAKHELVTHLQADAATSKGIDDAINDLTLPDEPPGL